MSETSRTLLELDLQHLVKDTINATDRGTCTGLSGSVSQKLQFECSGDFMWAAYTMTLYECIDTLS